MSSGISAVWLAADVDWDGHMDLDGWGWVLMTLGMIAFWGLLVFGVVWIARDLGRRPVGSRFNTESEAGPDPAAVLDRRLAEGDISLEDYRERRRALSGEVDESGGSS